jgi:arylsulfatase A-like enzyme
MGIRDRLFGRAAEAAPPAPTTSPILRPRPAPPPGASNYVILILDSCRFDSWVRAKPKVMSKLGPLEKRYTYATWTAPSHYNLLIGLLPHSSPPQVYASEYYKDDFLKFKDRFRLPDMTFGSMVPNLWLPKYLQSIGYRTNMFVSMPVLNPETPINVGFDTFELLDHHNDVTQAFRKMRFYEDRPSFFVINTGETHYPYATPDEPENHWPRISGVNGVFKHLDDHLRKGGIVPASAADKFFDDDKMKQLHRRQVNAVEWVDRQVEMLFDLCPDNTYITITADHGELFGESGYFGHGPINHEKCIEVPFVEGRLR